MSLVLWLGLAVAGGGADRVVDHFLKAAAAGRVDEARALCEPTFRDRDRMSCGRLVKELADDERHPVLVRAASAGDTTGGVVVLWALVGADTVPIWLRAAPTPEGWRLIDGGDAEQPFPELPWDLGAWAIPVHDDPLTTTLRAIQAGGDALLPRCTDRLQRAADDGCAELAATPERPGVTLALNGYQERGARGVARWDLLHDGQPVDRVWIYLEEADGWQVAGVDESAGHAAAFLARELPAAIDAADWVEDPLVDAIRRWLIEGVAAGHGPDAADGWPGVTGPATLDVRWAKLLRGTDRAAVCGSVAGQLAWTTWQLRDDGPHRVRQGFTQGECRIGLDDLAP